MEERLSLRRRIALDITKKLQDDVIEKHPLQQLFWECTLRCNHHCRHCGSDCKQTASVKDMPMEDFGRVLDSVAAATDPHKVMARMLLPGMEMFGVKVVSFTGGSLRNAKLPGRGASTVRRR